MRTRVVPVLTCLVLANCDVAGPCDLIVDPAIRVWISHATSGVPLADSAWGMVIDGSYSDSLRGSVYDGQGTMVARRAADEREGVYTVLVQRAGFQNWSTSGVRAESGDCGVRTARVDAHLVPLP